ncbi:MAG: GNAT family N-acetyltransferase [Deltaproteobacteria bacterium]|nr:GNAT family N-acetyltransferase [Deltaproteobacteria bacterium]
MPEAATIRRAGAPDLPTLLPLLRAYWEYDGIEYREAEVHRGLAELCAHPELGGAYLIERSAEAVGYFIFTWGFDLEFGGRHGWLTDLYLLPSERGQGRGRQVFAFIDELLREAGASCVELVVERDNAEAQAFYRRLGFVAADRVPLARRLPSANELG